jgi:PAS domain S-box-containing protein
LHESYAMPSWQETLNAGRRELPSSLYESPWHLMAILVLSIFLAETVMMGFLYLFLYFPSSQPFWNALDLRVIIFIVVPLLLIVFLWPPLVYFVLRPLRRNISERRQIEEALSQQEKNFRSLAENSPDIIMRFDRQFRFLYINPAFERRIGMLAESIVGKTGRELGMARGLTESWEKEICLAFSTGQPASIETSYPVSDPSLFEARLVPETTADGSIPTVLVISRDITRRKKAEAELRTSREQLRDLSCHLQAVREEERTRIARDIHDELGQVLATLAIEVGLLESELPPDRDDLHCKASSMKGLIDSTIKTVQRVSAELRPVMLDELGLASAIQWHVRDFQKRTNIRCDVRIGLKSEGPDRERSTTLFRILQEMLTNVLRHAEATRVTVRLTETAEGFVLLVSDNGRGITQKEITDRFSLGLLGMRERAEFWGGMVEIKGFSQRGTTLEVTIPREREPKPVLSLWRSGTESRSQEPEARLVG